MVSLRHSLSLTATACALALALGLSGCGGGSSGGVAVRNPSPRPVAESFSFESGIEGWSSKAVDVDQPPVEWSVRPSVERAREGRGSLRFFLNNLTDAGKVWIERPFAVAPNRRHRVNIRFAFATADFGDINLWRIIAGARPRPAQTRDDLIFQGDTGNGATSDVGYRWLAKNYDIEATSGADGRLYVQVGIWGTWETPRTYFIDNLRVTLTPL